MSANAKTSQLAKGIAVIRALSGHEFDGLRLTQVAQACGLQVPNTLHLLEELEALGITQRNPRENGLWHLGPAMVQMALAFQAHLSLAHQRLADFEHNYTRTPN